MALLVIRDVNFARGLWKCIAMLTEFIASRCIAVGLLVLVIVIGTVCYNSQGGDDVYKLIFCEKEKGLKIWEYVE